MDKNVSRREMLQYLALISGSAAIPIFFTGCAVDPVSGKKQLITLSQQQEIEIDKLHSPFQFSSDYGITQDRQLNNYISQIGSRLVKNVHRQEMPYNFQCVNAACINAYAFPGGSIAVTRGILLKLDNEAEFASLLGHELGHINARHSAEQRTKRQISSLLISGLSVVAETQVSGLGRITQELGMAGQGLLLSHYSRDNEREADSLGNQYMVKTGFSTQGFVGLMEMLDSLHKKKPESSRILFATHPMSSERLESAVQRKKGVYLSSLSLPLNRERYMDSIAALRSQEKGIELLLKGEKYLGKREYGNAENTFKETIKILKHDYTAHVLMSKCLMVMKKPSQALAFAENAKKIYPGEAQALYIAGLANKELKKYNKAFHNFDRCDAVLPGNPQVKFYKGYCRENLNNRKEAASYYMQYLKMVNYRPGKFSQHAYNRLKSWGYAR